MGSQKAVIALTLAAGLLLSAIVVAAAEPKVTKFCRFQAGKTTAFGKVEGGTVQEIAGSIFGAWKLTGKTHALSAVRLLVPVTPGKVLCMAGNYRSHHPDQVVDPKFAIPQLFFKPPSALLPSGADIVLPRGTTNVHYEAETVLVIGKRAKNVPKEKALDYGFGVTCGNDISARDWQKDDVQWWRAKGCDTFGPCGPFVVTGLNYDDLLVTLRHNGEIKQQQSTRDLIHDVATVVSFISRHVTLMPGDLIYTGTPGTTGPIKPGDVCEVEVEGVGVLKNRVVAGP
ncbi:MAG: fumarylacetoacetate hydrolase family protein [Verrucomicrobiae bacterium]|nr:fumarylacetoacetate hydrolase family protein [Verrucomicrobiae bacterium]